MVDIQQAAIQAAIDIGSNTIHVVVARCLPSDVLIVADEVEMVRIGESVTQTGTISEQKRDAAIQVLQQYKALAERHEAQSIFVVATEAIRKASNSAQFLTDVKNVTGLDVYLIDGNVEATLTFYGATYELLQLPDVPEILGVMDLGGGSTELITAQQEHIRWRISIPLGSGWLHDRYLPSDPPTADEKEIAFTFLDTYLKGVHPEQNPPALIVTGGSANSLLSMARLVFARDENETRLTIQDIAQCVDLLSTLPAAEVAQRYQQPAARAKILPAGTLIIQAVMERFQLQEIRVSPHGIREGVLLAYARFDNQWLQRVQAIAKGEDEQATKQKASSHKEDEQTFYQAGRKAVLERAHKLLFWREDILKDEDIEAVHKMRVATRRLRAALDAYESLCEPKHFKKVYRRIKKIADMLGNARDTDVMIQNLRQQADHVGSDEQAGIEWFIERLEAYRRRQQVVLEDFFKSFDEQAFIRHVEACFVESEDKRGKS